MDVGGPNRMTLQDFRLEKLVMWATVVAVEKEKSEWIHRIFRR